MSGFINSFVKEAVLRDTRLPRLISGELRVTDPARFLEGVVA